ncbi:hypothetical protein [Halpernia sp. GG3]
MFNLFYNFAAVIRNKNLKKYLSVLFSSIYLFAFIFAANIHNHNGGYFYKDFNFKSSSSNFSKQSAVNIGDDCLSCHFASAPIILPDTANFEISNKYLADYVQILTFAQKTASPHFSFFLRGPPNKFI